MAVTGTQAIKGIEKTSMESNIHTALSIIDGLKRCLGSPSYRSYRGGLVIQPSRRAICLGYSIVILCLSESNSAPLRYVGDMLCRFVAVPYEYTLLHVHSPSMTDLEGMI